LGRRLRRRWAFAPPGAETRPASANIGLLALSAAAKATPSGFALAIEPDIWLCHLINRSSREIAEKRLSAAPVRVLCASRPANWV